MNLRAICPRCEEIQLRRADIRLVGQDVPVMVPTHARLHPCELLHDRVMLTCSAGHSSVIKLTVPHHQVLFELAIFALNDGYTRECVLDAAAALERFQDWAAQLSPARSAPPESTPAENHEAAALLHACRYLGAIPEHRAATRFLTWAYQPLARGEIAVRNQFPSLSAFLDAERETFALGPEAGLAPLAANAVGWWRTLELELLGDQLALWAQQIAETGLGPPKEWPSGPRQCPAEVLAKVEQLPTPHFFNESTTRLAMLASLVLS